MIFTLEFMMRILAGTIAGLVIGHTRKNKPAGPWTFALICLGAVVFTLVSADGLVDASDKSRIISQIVSGVGFLGVGVIWKTENRLLGLTTAAAIWSTASLGILIGLAAWELSLIVFVLIVAILYSKPLEQKIERKIDKNASSIKSDKSGAFKLKGGKSSS